MKIRCSELAGRRLVRWLCGALAVIAFGPAAASAQSDTDGDFVPDGFDNCLSVANGPNEASFQVDTDVDGYGNACDADYDGNFGISVADYQILLPTLTLPGGLTDHDGNEVVTIADFAYFLSQFTASPPAEPGPSGLPCAGTPPCTP